MPREYAAILADADLKSFRGHGATPIHMPQNRSHDDAQTSRCTPLHCVVCDKWLVGLVLLTLVRTGEALAGEQIVVPGGSLQPDLAASRQRTPLCASMVPVPAAFQAQDLPEGNSFSTQEFRPRGRSVLEKEPRADAFDDAPMIEGTTMWQRLSEYRSHGRVQLLTLWETGGSSVSLLAGKKGEPSLQWTSRLMNRGGAAHGLLDRFFSTSLAGGGRGLHFSPRTGNPEPVGKPVKVMDVGGSK